MKQNLLELSKKGQIVVFTYYADTLEYLYKDILSDKRFSNLKIEAISSSGKVTSKSSNKREKIIKKFMVRMIIIMYFGI